MFAGVVVSTLTLVSCGFGKSGERSVESAFSKNSMLVMTIDFSDNTQVKNFNSLVDQFPTTGFMGFIPKAFDAQVKADGFTWKEDVQPILDGEWKIGVGMSLPSKEAIKKNADPKLIFAAKFSETAKVKDLLEKLMAKKNGIFAYVKYEKKDGVEYWINASSKFYLALDKGVFVTAPNEAAMREGVKTLDENDGLDKSENFKSHSKKMGGGFMTSYFNTKSILDSADPEDEIGKGLVEMFETMTDSYSGIFAEVDGFRAMGSVSVNEKSSGFKKFLLDPNYKLSLIDKVNGKGLFFYVEGGSLKNGFVSYLLEAGNAAENPTAENTTGNSLQTSVFGALGADAPSSIIDVSATSNPPYGKILEFLKKIDVLLSSPFAISISDKENYLPAMAFYFQLKADDVAKGKQLITDFDSYADEVITLLNKDFVKKDVIVVNGAALHKVYVDWKAVPQEMINEWSTASGVNVTTVKNEFYYGLMSDNVFVIAWYPDFPTTYGQDVLSQNADYKEAFNKLGDGYGMSVSYFNTKSLITFIDKFLVAFTTLSADDPVKRDLALGYMKLAEKFIGTVKYSISSSIYKDGQMNAKSFMRIQKVVDEASQTK